MDQGMVLGQGPVSEVLGRTDLPLARDDDAGALLQATVAERDTRWHLARVAFDGGSLWLRDDGLPQGTSVRVRVLARDVSIASEAPPPGAMSIQNALPCTVRRTGPAAHPSQVLVQLDCGGSMLMARITARAAHALELVPGRPVWALVKSAALVR
jgi:molybdate transport system ATP-binding protein